MVATGWTDTFNRTSVNSLGTATSGQAYAVVTPTTQYSVTPSTASIAIASAGDKYGVIDLQTQSLDVTAQVALSAIPATNLAAVGFAAKLLNVTNYYYATMMVATGGAVSLRFTKVIGGGLTNISTTLVTGLTYVANTFYNLRYSIFWSRLLQTNVMSLKLWAVGTTEPGGWMATATDAALTDYTSGTQVGILARDESTVVGTITAKFQNLLARSYNLPMPATTDPMCYDPAVTYPKQTVLQSIASAADTAMATIDPLTSIAGLFPRVRVSNSNVPVDTSAFSGLVYNATEFNIGTNTNLGYDNTGLYLPVGIWLVAFEIQLVEAASNYFTAFFFGGPLATQIAFNMRSNAVQSNDQGVGGTGHGSTLVPSSDPTTPIRCGVSLSPNNSATTYTIRYVALSAIKVSDYFL